jgi:hypothetical protein
VRPTLGTAASADTDRREGRFAADDWRAIRPWLPKIAEIHRGFGPLRSMTQVARADPSAPSYRIVYRSLSRILAVRVDAAGRIRQQEGSGRVSPRPNISGTGR